MRIGFIIGRIGGVDGVALETEKWIHVLKRMGHETYILAGRFEERPQEPGCEDLLPELFFFSPECEWEQFHAYLGGPATQAQIMAHIERQAELIANGIQRWVLDRKLDIVVSENASALPCHISMGLGIKRAVERLQLPTITHDHDFAWERGNRYKSPHPQVNELVEEIFPLRSNWSQHAVINSNAQTVMRERFDRASIVVPNVMDFDAAYGLKDEYNATLPQDLGCKPSDILLFQITRIVRRKGIEVAIKLLHKLGDHAIKLVVTGTAHDDPGGHYHSELVALAQRLGVEEQIVFAADVIGNFRQTGHNGRKFYSLSDAYAHARACTYFSTYEGFGNAFLEWILARRPIFVNNYEPVYWPDIGCKGFETVMLEDNLLTESAVAQMSDIIHDSARCREIADHNFELGDRYFSYAVLEQKLTELLP